MTSFNYPRKKCFPTVNHRRRNPNSGGEVDVEVFAAAASSNATDDLQIRNDCTTNTAKESASEQSILDLRSAQIRYCDLMRTRNNLICREFAPRNHLSEAQIRELTEEQKNVRKSRKKIEEAKGPTKLQLEQRR